MREDQLQVSILLRLHIHVHIGLCSSPEKEFAIGQVANMTHHTSHMTVKGRACGLIFVDLDNLCVSAGLAIIQCPQETVNGRALGFSSQYPDSCFAIAGLAINQGSQETVNGRGSAPPPPPPLTPPPGSPGPQGRRGMSARKQLPDRPIYQAPARESALAGVLPHSALANFCTIESLH